MANGRDCGVSRPIFWSMGSSGDSGITLLGGGGHALVVHAAIRAGGGSIAGFLDDNPRAALATLDAAVWLGKTSAVAEQLRAGRVHADRLLLAIGDLRTRERVLAGLRDAGVRVDAFSCIVRHPEAIIDGSATLAGDVFVGPRAIVQAHAKIGVHAILNSGAIVEHECVIGENAHIAPGAILAGNVHVGAGTLVGIGARVLPGVTIGAGCVVGAGAVVTRDVGDGVTVVGAPAKALGGPAVSAGSGGA